MQISQLIFGAFLVLFVSRFNTSNGGGIIPSSPPGFEYNYGNPLAPVQIDMFTDLLCPVSKMAYKTVKKVAAKYNTTQLRIRMHLFPLPYHHNAFLVAQSAVTITRVLGKEHFNKWMETIYQNQDKYWNKQMKDLGQVEVTNILQKLAQQTFPSLTTPMWRSGMSGFGGTDMDSETRTLWKYACSRGVTGTPTFFVNDVAVEADGSWTLKQWEELIDHVIKQNQPLILRNPSIVSATRPNRLTFYTTFLNQDIATKMCKVKSFARACMFEFGRIMCCTEVERCAVKIGCISNE